MSIDRVARYIDHNSPKRKNRTKLSQRMALFSRGVSVTNHRAFASNAHYKYRLRTMHPAGLIYTIPLLSWLQFHWHVRRWPIPNQKTISDTIWIEKCIPYLYEDHSIPFDLVDD